LGMCSDKDKESLAKTALYWTPEGKRRQGRLKTTWRRMVEAELQSRGKTLEQLSRVAEDNSKWRNAFAALCARRHKGQ